LFHAVEQLPTPVPEGFPALVCFNKSVFMNSQTFIHMLERIIFPNMSQTRKKCLLLDEAGTHYSKAVTKHLEDNHKDTTRLNPGQHHYVIVSKSTPGSARGQLSNHMPHTPLPRRYMEPPDVGYHADFHRAFDTRMATEKREFWAKHPDKRPTASQLREIVVRAVVFVWYLDVSLESIAAAFKRSGISINNDGSENERARVELPSGLVVYPRRGGVRVEGDSSTTSQEGQGVVVKGKGCERRGPLTGFVEPKAAQAVGTRLHQARYN
jgi:hypothetical protein